MSKTDQELYQLADTFQKQTGIRVLRAALADANGRVDVPGYDGAMVYVRYYTATGFSQPFEVAWRAGSMTKTPGTGVIVEYDYDKVLAIKRADYNAMAAQGTNPTINNPADPNNSHYIQQMRLVTFTSHPVSSAADSMLVAVQSGTVLDLDADAVTLFPGEQVDLTSYIPGGAGEWCLACLFWKDDNTIEVVASTPKTAMADLDLDDVNECIAARTAGSLPIWAWQLYNGQTGIAAGAPATGGDDFLDLRPLFFMLQTGDSGSSVAVTDGTTTVDPTTEIDFDAAYFDVTSPGGDVAGVTGSTDLGKTISALAAKFLLQQSNANLPNAQAMGALSTGIVKNTTTTGVQSIAVAGTDYTSPTGTENLSNKTITASSLIATALSLLIGGFKAIFTHANTADRTYTFQDSSDTIVGRATTDTLTNKTLTSPTVNTPVISGGTIDNTPVGTTTRALGYFSAIREYIGGFAAIFTHGNTADRTYTFPDFNGTMATLAGTETFTNKTLTSPTITGGTINNTPIGGTTPNTGAFTNTSQTTYRDSTETSAPSTPASDHARDWIEDYNGVSVLRWMNSTGISFTIGRDTFVIAKNVTGSTIAVSNFVYFGGGSAVNDATIAGLAIANSTIDKLAKGITRQSIANNAYGIVQIGGSYPQTGLSLSPAGFIYLSDSAAGTGTPTPPTGTSWVQPIAISTYSAATSDLLLLFDPPYPNNLDGGAITGGTVAAARLGTMTGATNSGAGAKGAAPQPAAGDDIYALSGAATYIRVDRLLASQYSTVTFTTTNVDTSLLTGSVLGTFTIPANGLRAGSELTFDAWGIASRTSGNTTIKFKWGATTVFTIGPSAIAWGTTANALWHAHLKGTVQSTGGSGSVMWSGQFTYYTSASTTAPAQTVEWQATAVTTDTTATVAPDLSWTWQTGSTGQTTSLQNCSLKQAG